MQPTLCMLLLTLGFSTLCGCPTPTRTTFPTWQTGPQRAENERYQLHDPFPDRTAGPDTMVRPRGYDRQRSESRQAIENTMPEGVRGGRAVPGPQFGPPGEVPPQGASATPSWQYPETVPY